MRKNISFLVGLVCTLVLVGVAFVFHFGSHGSVPSTLSMEDFLKVKDSHESSKVYKVSDPHAAYMGYEKLSFFNAAQAGKGDTESVLLLASIASENSFGPERTFKDFLQVINSIDRTGLLMNMAFYCGTPKLLREMELLFEDLIARGDFAFGKVTLLHAEFLGASFDASNHDPSVQRLRRRKIAQGRNFVLFNSLESETYTLFMDADIIKIEHPDMLKRFIKSKNAIIVPLVNKPTLTDYDKNSWRGERVVPNEEQLKLMDANQWDKVNFEPFDKPGMYHLQKHVDETRNLPSTDPRRDPDYAVPLDSVGGAVLFAKSEVYKQGVNFPVLNLVGTTWQRHEGFDGIETEGVCYIARTLGYGCWAMPNLVAMHVNR